jgi:hypothetical protein
MVTRLSLADYRVAVKSEKFLEVLETVDNLLLAEG